MLRFGKEAPFAMGLNFWKPATCQKWKSLSELVETWPLNSLSQEHESDVIYRHTGFLSDTRIQRGHHHDVPTKGTPSSRRKHPTNSAVQAFSTSPPGRAEGKCLGYLHIPVVPSSRLGVIAVTAKSWPQASNKVLKSKQQSAACPRFSILGTSPEPSNSYIHRRVQP